MMPTEQEIGGGGWGRNYRTIPMILAAFLAVPVFTVGLYAGSFWANAATTSWPSQAAVCGDSMNRR